MTARTDWRAVAVIAAAGIASACHIGKVPPALPAIREQLAFGLIGAGWVLSLFSVLAAAFGMAMGALAGRLGERRVAVFGLLLLASASVAGGFASSLAMLLVTRLAEGIGFMLAAVSAPALVVRATVPADRPLAFGLWGAYNPTGTTLMLLLAPPALALGGWQFEWAVAAALAGLAALALTVSVAPDEDAPTRFNVYTLAVDAWTVLRAPRLLLLAGAFASYVFGYMVVFGFLPSLLVEAGLAPASAALLTAVAVASNAAGNVAGGTLIHRGWPRWQVIGAASLGMGLFSTGIYADALPIGVRFACCLGYTFVGGWLPSTVLGAAAAAAPEARLVPMANGLIVQASGLGQLLGPPLAAAVAVASGGWRLTPLVLAASASLGLVCAILLGRVERR